MNYQNIYSIRCNACNHPCKSISGFTRHLANSFGCNEIGRYSFSYTNNIVPIYKRIKQSSDQCNSSFIYNVNIDDNLSEEQQYSPTWDSYYLDSHLQPFHQDKEDRDLLFINNMTYSNKECSNLCHTNNHWEENDYPTMEQIQAFVSEEENPEVDIHNDFVNVENIDLCWNKRQSQTEIDITSLYSNNIYQDDLNGIKTNEELFALELFNLLKDADAPNYVFNDVMTLVEKYLSLGLKNIPTSFSRRKNVVQHFSSRYNMNCLKPRLSSITYKSKSFPLVTWNAEDMIMSLLEDKILMFNDKNLIFPTDDGTPFGKLNDRVDCIGDIHTSKAYHDAYRRIQVDKEKDLPIGLIFYFDKITLDKHGHLSLDPVQFTLSIFNRQTRNSSLAWKPFGYIPNINLHSKAESKHLFKAEDKALLTHLIIEKILKEYKDLEETGIPNYSFKYKNKLYVANLKFFILVILGDTESHDKLCGHYNCRNLLVQCICRHCKVPSNELDNPYANYELTSQKLMDELITSQDRDKLKIYSQYCFHTAWWNLGINFGGHPYGIHGVTPSEPLHMIDLGIFKYLVETFFSSVGNKGCKVHSLMDSWCKRVGRYLQHQSDKNLPRTYFPYGVSGSTKLNGHEYIGVILVLFVLLKMEGPRRTLSNYNVSNETMNGWASLFELCICWRKWLQRENIPKAELEHSVVAHQKLMSIILKCAPRIDGNEWKIIKFHMVSHIVLSMSDFGVPLNFDTSAPESNHKYNVKKPANHTQSRASCLEIQTASRYYENMVMQYAAQVLLPSINTNKDKSNNKKLGKNIMSGSKFQLIGSSNSIEESNVDSVHLNWEAKDVKSTFHRKYVSWLGKHLLKSIGPYIPIDGCTEYNRNGLIFRAHPNYRSTGGWFDWALFKWEVDEGVFIDIPGQIVMFFWIPQQNHPIEIDGRCTVQDEGLYALVESCSTAMPEISKRNRIYEVKDKKVNRTRKRKKCKEISDKCLYVVSVDTINDAIAAIPNLGSGDFDFIVLRPSKEWHKGFTHFIEESNK